MRILSFMNVSNPDRISTDSGWIFYNLLGREFVKQGHDFTFAAPVNLDKFEHPPSAANDHGCFEFFPIDFGKTKYEVRFSFPYREAKEAIKNADPDIIIVNQLEVARNISAAIKDVSSTAKIVSYAHYIPWWFNDTFSFDPSQDHNGISEEVIDAFLDGIGRSSLVFTHSKTSYDFLTKGIAWLAEQNPKYKYLMDNNNYRILPPPFDPVLYSQNVGPRNTSDVIYNHRLYQHYGADFLPGMADGLKSLNAPFVILDVLGDRGAERKRLDPYPDEIKDRLLAIEGVEISTEGSDRVKYKGRIDDCAFGLAPIRRGTPWSMSCIDLMCAGKPVIAPVWGQENPGWYAEVLPQELLFNAYKPDTAVAIADRLLNDQEFYIRMASQCQESANTFSPANIANQFIREFRLLLSPPNLRATFAFNPLECRV